MMKNNPTTDRWVWKTDEDGNYIKVSEYHTDKDGNYIKIGEFDTDKDGNYIVRLQR
jgi:protocatechuate 3,4-dioxygenase beta subunit